MQGGEWLDRLRLVGVGIYSRRALAKFFNAAGNGRKTQDRILIQRIRRNADSDFGRAHQFTSISSYDEFARRVPVMTYEDLEPYVRRVMNGETSAMFGPGQTVRMFAMTSGTTDRPKYVPVTDAFVREYRRGWSAFGFKSLEDHGNAFLRPIVQTSSPMDSEQTMTGVPCGSISGLLAKTQLRLVQRYYAAPPTVGYIDDLTARAYVIMRLAVPQNVAFLVTASPAMNLRLVETADRYAETLIRDIHDGTISSKFDVPDRIRKSLAPLLKGDAVTAGRLECIVRDTSRLLPKDYWNLAFVANWTGGTMGLHLRRFPEYFGRTPVRDIGLLATEGRMSVCIDDATPAGLLDVGTNFFEFIPEDDDGSVLRSHELCEGRAYRILLTNSAGFYRYDIGDFVRVTGMYADTPMIEFLHKGRHMSSMTGEKISEQQVVQAFDRAIQGTGPADGLFVLAPRWGDPPCYRLYMEALQKTPAPDSDAAELARRFDDALSQINMEYASKRHSGRLNQIEFVILPAGTLAARNRDLIRDRQASNEQFKHQYLLSQPGNDRDLDGCGISQGSFETPKVSTSQHVPTPTVRYE
jgi:hypothetical protein